MKDAKFFQSVYTRIHQDSTYQFELAEASEVGIALVDGGEFTLGWDRRADVVMLRSGSNSLLIRPEAANSAALLQDTRGAKPFVTTLGPPTRQDYLESKLRQAVNEIERIAHASSKAERHRRADELAARWPEKDQ